MNFVVKSLNLILSVIIWNGLFGAEAQSGTSVILGSKHYYIETTSQVGFYEAAHNCAQMGMTLASPDTDSDEQKRLKSFLTINEILDKLYWLSGVKLTADTIYTWLGTGKPLKTAPGGTGDCVATDATFVNTADTCTVEKYYICEKSLDPPCGKYGQCRYSYSSNSK